MGNIVGNISKGRIAHYSSLPAANDALILVLLQSTGLETDAVLRDYDDLAAVLLATNDEATFTGYTRRTLASVTVTVDDTGDVVNMDAADPASYTNTGTAQSVGKAVIVYDPDTTAGTDSTLVPLVFLDCVLTFDVGVATTLSFDALGFASAA